VVHLKTLTMQIKNDFHNYFHIMIAQNIKSLDEKITPFDFIGCDGKIYFCENNNCNIVLKNENILKK
jgi:hypothetical protein